MSEFSTDCFSLLGVPRRPWLDPEELKLRFLALSSAHHPDAQSPNPNAGTDQAAAPGAPGASADAQFAALNGAYQTLRDPRTRLAHLLELETGQAPTRVEAVEGALADLFFQVGALCRQVDAFLVERTRATSPLAKAGVFARGLDWTGKVQDLNQAIGQARAAVDEELRQMNTPWETPTPASGPRAGEAPAPAGEKPLARLEAIYRQVSYLNRWSAQLQERLVQLAV